MAKRKKFKPTAPMLVKEAAEWRRAFNKWHAVNDGTEPVYRAEVSRLVGKRERVKYERAAKHTRALVLYAAALGHKRGLLPYDLRECGATWAEGAKPGTAFVTFKPEAGASVTIPLSFLDWEPDEPVCETDLLLAA